EFVGEFTDKLLEAKQILCCGWTPARERALRICEHLVQLDLHMRALIQVFGTVCPCNSDADALGIRSCLPDNLVIDRRQSPVLLHPGANDMARFGDVCQGFRAIECCLHARTRAPYVVQSSLP